MQAARRARCGRARIAARRCCSPRCRCIASSACAQQHARRARIAHACSIGDRRIRARRPHAPPARAPPPPRAAAAPPPPRAPRLVRYVLHVDLQCSYSMIVVTCTQCEIWPAVPDPRYCVRSACGRTALRHLLCGRRCGVGCCRRPSTVCGWVW